MKKLSLITISLLASFTIATAQTNAILALENQEYKVAKESIDKYFTKNAATIATNPKEAKAWFYKGKIYNIVATSDKPEIKALGDEKSLAVAVEAFRKAVELDNSKSAEWKKQSQDQLEAIWGVTFNEGIKKYQENDLKASLTNMDLCISIKPADTLAYTVGASIAISAKDFAWAKKAYYSLIEKGFKNYNYYKNLLYIVSEEEKNTDETMKVIQMGREAFPMDAMFMAQEVNLYITSGKTQEAIAKLEAAAKNDAANAKVYYYNLGIIYKQTNDNVKAREFFAKSLAEDANYEGANYMTGFMFMEEGDVLNKKINNMTLKEYNLNGKKEEAKRDEFYKKAIPYLEKSYAVSKDEKVKDQLISIYKKFKMEDKIKSLN